MPDLARPLLRETIDSTARFTPGAQIGVFAPGISRAAAFTADIMRHSSDPSMIYAATTGTIRYPNGAKVQAYSTNQLDNLPGTKLDFILVIYWEGLDSIYKTLVPQYLLPMVSHHPNPQDRILLTV